MEEKTNIVNFKYASSLREHAQIAYRKEQVLIKVGYVKKQTGGYTYE